MMLKSGCRVALPALFAATLAGAAFGEPAPEGDGPLDVGADVEIVTVDAVVLDKDGQPVEGLAPNDFIIREEGAAREIVNFEAVELPPASDQTAPRRAEAPTSRTTPPPAAQAIVDQGRRITIVFDDVHLTHAAALRAQDIVRRFLDTGLADGDQVRVTSTATAAAWTARVPEGLGDLRGFLARLKGHRPTRHPLAMTDWEATRIALHGDLGLLSEVFLRLCSEGLVGNMERCLEDAKKLDRRFPLDSNHFSDPFAPGDSAGRTALMVDAQRLQQEGRAKRIATLSHLTRVLTAAGSERGRKLVFVVSEGFLDDTDLSAWRTVLDSARRANAVLYFVDAGGETAVDASSGPDVMVPLHRFLAGDFYDRVQLESRGAATLAALTGGSSLRNPAAAADQMADILDRSRVYYLLGFEPRRAHDGKYHKLEVEVRRPGVKVIAREGYYAQDENAPQAADVDRRLLRAIDSPVDSAEVPLRLETYVLGPAAKDRVALLVAAEVDGAALAKPAHGKKARQHFDWALVATPQGEGRPSAAQWPMDLDLPEDALAYFGTHGLPAYRNMELPPGAYQVRVAVDSDGRVGSATQTLEVPAADTFRISTPILSDSARPATADRPPQPIPVAHRVFPSGATLLCLYGVYGARVDPSTGAPRVAASFDVGPAEGDPLIRRAPTELQPAADGSLAETVPLVLRGAAPGQYEMTIRVEDLVSGAVAERHERFTVR